MDPHSHPKNDPPGAEAIHRWMNFWNIISLGLLLFTTIFALVDTPWSLTNVLLITGFAGVHLVWYYAFIIRQDRRRHNSLLLALSFALIILALAGMTRVNSIYTMLLFSLYAIIFSILRMSLAIPMTIFLSVVGASIIIFSNHMTLSDATGVIVTFSIGAFFSVILGLFIGTIIRQSIEREDIINELKAARADLARVEREAGVLEERQRLAREIHDTLAQGFTSIVMHLEAADQTLPREDPQFATAILHLDRARTTARESLTEARRFVWALRTELLERETLGQAIQRAAQRWAAETGQRVQVEITGDENSLPSPYEVTLLRAVQEALANIHKHAGSQQVNLTLTYLDDQVILDVQDDGQGFDPGQISPPGDGSGYGLLGMRERVEQLGGSLVLESVPGEGTTLVVELPLNAAPHPSKETT